MSISIGDCILKIRADKAEFDKSMQEVGQQVENMKKGLLVVGTAFTAVGVAGLKMATDFRKMNAELGQIAITTGLTTKELRDLTLGITDVSFGVNSVISTFNLLARAGVKNENQLKNSALAFEALGHAIGQSAESVADMLIPAFNVFGKSLPQSAGALDKFTWLVHNTTVDLSDFASAMNYVALYGDKLNVSLDDMISIMAILEDRGIKGAAATRKFRTAVTEAVTSGISLNKALGISDDLLDSYNEKVGIDAVGATNKYKAAADKQYGVMDKLKSAWEKLTLRMGGILTVLEPILGFMTAIGPVMIAVAMGAIPKLIAGIRGLGIAMSTFAATPAGAVITAISLVTIGVVALVNLFKGSASDAIDKLKDKMKELGDTIISTMDTATQKVISDAQNMAEEAKRPIQKLIDFLNEKQTIGGMELLSDEQLARIKAVNPELAAQLETLQNGIKGIQANYDTLDESIRKKRIIEIQTELKNPLLTKQEQLDLYSELGTLTGEEWQKALKDNAPDLVTILEQQKTDIDTALANQLASWNTYFAAVKAGWDGTSGYVANTIMPAISEAVINGILTPEAAKKLTDSFTTLMGQINQTIAKYTEKSSWTLTMTPVKELPPSLPPDWLKNLPSKQYGGVVPGPIGQPIPILAHGGEVFSGVYPGLENMGRSMSSQEIHQHFHVGTLIADEIGLRQFMRRIKDLSGEDGRRNAFAQVNQGYYFGKSGI